MTWQILLVLSHFGKLLLEIKHCFLSYGPCIQIIPICYQRIMMTLEKRLDNQISIEHLENNTGLANLYLAVKVLASFSAVTTHLSTLSLV